MTSLSRPAQLRALYRNLLKQAKVFPSIKRKELYEDIRQEFRENKGLTDEAKIEKEIEKAVRGVQQMAMYTSLDPNASEWTVQMDENPMPAPDGKAGPQL
mmetsp:Transcript_8292/g.25970  ORF Transcript_8292/g.25970 Transcript_8292/m.25970 type:complete len:100 (+) Transcript_8292:31-330(+)